MKKEITSAVLASILLIGCSGRQANTVSEYHPGDAKKTCNALGMEVSNLETDMNRKWADKNNQTGANVALGVAGAFLLVPWFFMDFGGADQTEYESFKRRRDYLKVTLADKDCSEELDSIAKREKKMMEEAELKKKEMQDKNLTNS